ncbi:ribonuclease J [Candidatus Shapirobacteria bacterium]|nr:ribonuclease J [Candidatus Shapirobacteria bacterium]
MLNKNFKPNPNVRLPIQSQFSGAPSQVRQFNSKLDSVRIVSLGGFGDVTQNMYVYEFIPSGDESKSQIIIVDCGVGFPEEDDFGVDLQIPDTKYLDNKKDRILGIFITHGHEDHIGALRFILPILGTNIPIHAPRMAAAFIEGRLVEANIRAKMTVYESGDTLATGPFSIETIRVNHSVPDTNHFAITTPIGIIYHGSDFKFDLFPLDGKHTDFSRIARNGEKKIIALLSDSLGSEHEGFSPSESSIAEKFEHDIKTAKGRVFVTTISSNIIRWGQAIEYAKRAGRKIVTVGYSVDKAIKIGQELGYINITDADIVPVERVKNFAENKLIFLVAGFAAQANSALSKMVMGKHRVKIKSGDKVIFSSPDYIPGTTSKIFDLIDVLSKMGAEVVSGEGQEIHVSGHGYQKEHALLIKLVNPKYLLPIGGNYRHVKSYFTMAKTMGLKDEQFINPDDDSIITFYSDGTYDQKLHNPIRKVLIDGLGIGDVGTTVLRDRKLLAEEGMFSVVLMVNKASGNLVREPEILSRGFVFMKDNNDLMDYLKQEIATKFKDVTSVPANFEFIRQQIQAHIEQIIMDKTGRQPMVLPLVIEV